MPTVRKSLALALSAVCATVIVVAISWGREPSEEILRPRAAKPLIFILPRGEATESNGFLVNSFSGVDPSFPPMTVRARMAWDEKGLSVLFDVLDGLGSKGVPRVVSLPEIAMGTTSQEGERRSLSIRVVQKEGSLSALVCPDGPQASVRRTQSGYAVQLRLPPEWMSRHPEAGSEFSAWARVTGGREGAVAVKSLWDVAGDPLLHPRFRLGEQSSPPLLGNLSWSYLGSDANKVRARVTFEGGEAITGDAVTVTDQDGVTIAKGPFVWTPKGCSFSADLNLDPSDWRYGRISAYVNGVLTATQTPPLPDGARLMSSATPFSARVGFDQYVFTGDRFPESRFESVEEFENTSRPYYRETAFVDSKGRAVSKPNGYGRFGAVVFVRRQGAVVATQRFTLFRAKSGPSNADPKAAVLRAAGADAARASELDKAWWARHGQKKRDALTAYVFSGNEFPKPLTPEVEAQYFDDTKKAVAYPTQNGRYGAILQSRNALGQMQKRYVTLFKTADHSLESPEEDDAVRMAASNATDARRANEQWWRPFKEVEANEITFDSYLVQGARFPQPAPRWPDALRACIGSYKVRPWFLDGKVREVAQASTPGRYGCVTQVTDATGQVYSWFATLYRGSGTTHGDQPTAIRLAAAKASEAAKEDARWWSAAKDKLEVRYTSVYLPKGYADHPNRKWPVIVYLHGAGAGVSYDLKTSRLFDGDVTPPVNTIGGVLMDVVQRGRPYIILKPMLSVKRLRWHADYIRAILDFESKRYRIDPDRVLLFGDSLGAKGAWRVATEDPNLFAALVPTSTSGFEGDQVSKLKGLPVWAFVGGKDPGLSGIQSTVDRLRKGGGQANLTVFEDAGHLVEERVSKVDGFWAWLEGRRRPR